jgi:hypothetical protein
MPLFENLGFTAHPFAKTNADEELNLADYFVPPPFFDAVIGDPNTPNASIVLAPRGGGKTALRRMLEDDAIKHRFLPVSYDRFEFSANQSLEDITLQYHLRNIIIRLLLAYLSYLADYPDLLNKLDKPNRRRISLFIHTYLGDITGDKLQDLLKELKGLPIRFREFWRDNVGFLESVVNLLLKNYDLEKINLPEVKQEEKNLTETYKHQIEYLNGLVKNLGFAAGYVLLDKPDETELTGNDPAATYQLIRPLIRDLELLGLSGFGFKFFLWDQIESAYRMDARPDRVHQYKLNWSREALQRVLSKRLKAFSEGKVSSLSALCEDGAPYDVDAAVCLLANHSPRNVIRICERIYAAQTERNAAANHIALTSVDQGILTYCEQVVTDTYGEEVVREMHRVGRELFTINYLANDVFKVQANAIRNRITAWTGTALAKQIGTVSVPTSKRPLNFYCIIDPAMVRLMHRRSSMENFLKDLWLTCDFCSTDNLMDITHFPDGNDPVCRGCGRDLF